MATPDFILNQEFEYTVSLYDSYTLPKGTFVRPIKLCYVPQHVRDKRFMGWFVKGVDVYCYTSKGIFPIPKRIITQVGGSAALDINTYMD